MKKLYFLLFLIIPFLFMSCGDPWVDVEVSSCKFNKEIYKLDEDIVFTCSGYFDETHPVTGYSALGITFYKKIDGDGDKDLNFEIIDSGNLDFKISYYNDRVDNSVKETPERSVYYGFTLFDNTILRNYKKKIIFRAKEPGMYRAHICISASKGYPQVNDINLTIPFSVEAK